MNIVSPKSFKGYNTTLLQIIGKGPKMSVVCGSCGLGFRGRIEMVDNPPLTCPHCKAVNKLPIFIKLGPIEEL